MTQYHFHTGAGQDAFAFAVSAMRVGFSVAFYGDGSEWGTVTLTDTALTSTLYRYGVAGESVPLGGGGEWDITAEGIEKIA